MRKLLCTAAIALIITSCADKGQSEGQKINTLDSYLRNALTSCGAYGSENRAKCTSLKQLESYGFSLLEGIKVIEIDCNFLKSEGKIVFEYEGYKRYIDSYGVIGEL